MGVPGPKHKEYTVNKKRERERKRVYCQFWCFGNLKFIAVIVKKLLQLCCQNVHATAIALMQLISWKCLSTPLPETSIQGKAGKFYSSIVSNNNMFHFEINTSALFEANNSTVFDRLALCAHFYKLLRSEGARFNSLSVLKWLHSRNCKLPSSLFLICTGKERKGGAGGRSLYEGRCLKEVAFQHSSISLALLAASLWLNHSLSFLTQKHAYTPNTCS